MLPGTLCGSDGSTKFMEDRDTFFSKTRRGAEERNGKLRVFCADVGDVEMVWACIILRLEKAKETDGWKQVHMGGLDGISCQHFQMMTQSLQKHWEWQEDRRPMMRNGSVTRPAMYLASMDMKTVFDVARPKHTAKT